MIIYTKNENYKIWANPEDMKFYIQMNGEAISHDGYDTAAQAISEAENDRKL